MARDYLREEVRNHPELLAELVPPKVELLINPSLSELLAAVKRVEKGSRKRCLHPDAVRELYEQPRSTESLVACIDSVKSVPRRYPYDFSHTQAASCWLGANVKGFAVRRTVTPPERRIEPIVYNEDPSYRTFNPRRWFDSVNMMFWTRLTDAELLGLQSELIIQLMAEETRKEAERAKRREERRNADEVDAKIMTMLMRRHFAPLTTLAEPEFVSHFQDACSRISAELADENLDVVPWREIKRRWPSVATRYEPQFIPLIESGKIRRHVLNEASHETPFTLSLQRWQGSQRIFNARQIVFCIDARARIQAYMDRHKRAAAIVRQVFMKRVCLHPAYNGTVGWLRIHMDNDRQILFVDEVQSDALEKVRQQKDHPQYKHLVALSKELMAWNLHGFASVRQWATALGYRTAIHSRETLISKCGATQSNRKWNTYYESIIKAFRLVEEEVESYPGTIMIEPAKNNIAA